MRWRLWTRLSDSSAANLGKSKPSRAPVAGETINGLGVSAGIAIGQILIIGRADPKPVEQFIHENALDAECARFRAARDLSVRQIEELRRRVAEVLGEKDAGVFDAHLMIIGDLSVATETEQLIRSRRCNADFAFDQVLGRYLKMLQQVEDPYFRDRQSDIRDIASRVIRNIQGETATDLASLSEPRIVLAHDLPPSETASMHKGSVIGFATVIGSRTSHTAIMARSLGIPALVGIPEDLDGAKNGDMAILDGYRGQIILRPTEEQIGAFRERQRAQEEWIRSVVAESELAAETLDGFRVQLAANIGLPDEVAEIRRSHGVGVGLFRSEYLFINQQVLPDEEKQYEAYRRVAEEIYPQSVIVRTLDIGGDKFLSHLNLPGELNPFLGIRAIRFCLTQPELFLTQLRAILRASAHGKVRILFPMIATVEEIRQAMEMLKKARKQLDERGVPYNRHMDVGIMIEVPSAAMLADRLAEHVDFFSIGTNDLIQYAMAADRSNPATAYLYQPTHPAIIRLLRDVMIAANKRGIWVSVCGEVAGDPLLTPLLLGLGIQELSMSLPSIGRVKHLLRGMRMHEAEALVAKSVTCSTAAEVKALCEAYVRGVAPEMLGE